MSDPATPPVTPSVAAPVVGGDGVAQAAFTGKAATPLSPASTKQAPETEHAAKLNKLADAIVAMTQALARSKAGELEAYRNYDAEAAKEWQPKVLVLADQNKRIVRSS